MNQDERDILYCGDTSLSGAASYLAGLMTAFGMSYDYVPSDQALSLDVASRPRKLLIFSDYASKQVGSQAEAVILQQVAGGAGLLMIGGWESFHGHGGDWESRELGRALPVEISREDDRVNCDQPALLIRAEEHAIATGLPWTTRPPTIGGFNRVISKSGSATILIVQRMGAAFESGRFEFTTLDQHPLLVLGSHKLGRTAALMTDLAPHWVGGLVDWSDGNRVTAQAPGGWEIDVGNFYSQLVLNLLAWTGQFDREQVF